LETSQIFDKEYNGEYIGNIGLLKGTDVYRKYAKMRYFLGEPFLNSLIMKKGISRISDCE